MAREQTLKTVGGVAALVLAVSVVAPALRRSTAQDTAPGPTLPAIVTAPPPAAAPMPAPVHIAQLPPATETAAPLPDVTTAPAGVAPAAAATAPAPAPAVGEERLQLRTLTAAQFHLRIEQIFGRPAPLMADDGSGWLRFTVDAGDNAPVLIAAQPQTGEVRIVGRVDQLLAWRRGIL